MLEGITPVHLIIVLVIALLILGPGKLPETGAALGKAVREFRQGMSDTVPAPASVSATPPSEAASPADPPSNVT